MKRETLFQVKRGTLVEKLQQAVLPKRHCRLEKVSVWKLDSSDYSSRERGFLQNSVLFILNILNVPPGFICFLVCLFWWGFLLFVCLWFLVWGFFKGNEFLKYTKYFTRDLKMLLKRFLSLLKKKWMVNFNNQWFQFRTVLTAQARALWSSASLFHQWYFSSLCGNFLTFFGGGSCTVPNMQIPYPRQ